MLRQRGSISKSLALALANSVRTISGTDLSLVTSTSTQAKLITLKSTTMLDLWNLLIFPSAVCNTVQLFLHKILLSQWNQMPAW
jgi:hypothetical protein